MNIEYKIIWFEDDKDAFNAKKKSVKRIVEELGFSFPDPRNEIDGSNVDTIDFEKYDLIISDLKLNGEEGTTLLDRIRSERGIFTEVVFYSSIGEKALRDELKKFDIDGVYCADRENERFKEKIRKVIETTIKKFQDINNTRGLFIGETIILEKKIENILINYFDILGPEEGIDKNEIIGSMHTKIIEKQSKFIEDIKSTDISKVKTLIDKDILTASNCYDALNSIIKKKLSLIKIIVNSKSEDKEIIATNKTKLVELEKLKKELNNFRDEILRIRNTLAHVEEEIGEDGIPFLKSINSEGTIIKFNNTKYIEIRKCLLKHNRNIDEITCHIN